MLPGPRPIPTVQIVDAESPTGFVIINESDFDEATHQRYVEKAPEAPKAPDTPKPPKK